MSLSRTVSACIPSCVVDLLDEIVMREELENRSERIKKLPLSALKPRGMMFISANTLPHQHKMDEVIG